MSRCRRAAPPFVCYALHKAFILNLCARRIIRLLGGSSLATQRAEWEIPTSQSVNSVASVRNPSSGAHALRASRRRAGRLRSRTLPRSAALSLTALSLAALSLTALSLTPMSVLSHPTLLCAPPEPSSSIITHKIRSAHIGRSARACGHSKSTPYAGRLWGERCHHAPLSFLTFLA